jgi:hypothetical protein
MKWFVNCYGRHRRSICLLAGGVLAEPETSKLMIHLAECADCRKYHDEMAALTKPLADWERNFAHVEPTPETQSRWANAIQAAADVNRRDQLVRELTFVAALRNAVRLLFLELIWSSRHVWSGLAVVWVVILAVNFSAHDPERIAGKSPPPSRDIILTLPQQEQLLAELMGPGEPRMAAPPRPFSPRPSSERRFEILTA